MLSRLSRYTRSRLSARPGPGRAGPADAERWLTILSEQRLKPEIRDRQVGRTSDSDEDGMLDLRLAGPGDPKGIEEAFDRLRWGGLFACVDPSAERVGQVMQRFDNANGFVIEQTFDELWGGPAGLRIPGITPRAYFFTARKVKLSRPGQTTQRFTFDVRLRPDAREPAGYCVRKKVPRVEDLACRLRQQTPDLKPEWAEARARKLIHEVFPVFLTRETRVLESLQKSLPDPLRRRVPKPLRIKRNAEGFVTCLDMRWLRNGGGPITQLQFARQAAELLDALHTRSQIMHLDLRPDNMVITPDGVGFVDFGSAAQIDEDLCGHPVLGPLFDQMMQTSQVQKDLGAMIRDGRVTCDSLAKLHGRADRGVDTFYLSLQINQPRANPELRRLIDHQPLGEVAKQLETLTASILRPKNPGRPGCKTAADLLRGIDRIQRRLG
jgi:hypothetical protein